MKESNLCRLELSKKTVARNHSNESKILRGIVRACEKTGIDSERLKAFVDSIESEIEEKFPREITSQQIGELILTQLSHISQVAYIRFASVYGNFTSVDDFVTTLKQLENKPLPNPIPINHQTSE